MGIFSRTPTSVLRTSTRSLARASIVSSPSSSSRLPSPFVPVAENAAEHQGPLRSHLKLPVNPSHGLYGFFRPKTNENSHSKLRDDGQPEYIAVEPPSQLSTSGRSWNTSELRRKSFGDLHTLWYILLRERNLLTTQKAERKRLTVSPMLTPNYSEQARKCKNSMARIKGVISERRNAYIQAARLRRALRRNPELLQSLKDIDDNRGAGEGMLEGGVAEAGALVHEANYAHNLRS